MKALILAAGFGNRLLPHTRMRPKPLFTIANEPVVHLLILRLIQAGCSGIIINTHHLHRQVAAFIRSRNYRVPVRIRHEPAILGTGGAIRNVAHFLGSGPFLVVNADIVTDLDFRALYRFHLHHPYPATLAMTADPALNSVWIDASGFVRSFTSAPGEGCRQMTFTGIQVLDSTILSHIPGGRPVESIAVYQSLIENGIGIKAWVPEALYWKDIGTSARYRAAVLDQMAPAAFSAAFGCRPDPCRIRYERLAGDGSDRSWHRMAAKGKTLILADHGISAAEAPCEIDSFVGIGAHLLARGIPVPAIHLHDRVSGMVFLEDLGDTLLYRWIRQHPREAAVSGLYRKVIEELVRMAMLGIEGLDPAICYQGPVYDRAFILDKECRYFVDAFLNGCLRLNIAYPVLSPEFSELADRAVENGVYGFMHRDFQSRNIMIRDGRPFFIDFQAGRMGPLQYDLASLLADPYAGLPEKIQQELFLHARSSLERYQPVEAAGFAAGYAACRLTRTLQVLAAFGHLSTVKQKPFFRQFIPAALADLNLQLNQWSGRFPGLRQAARLAHKAAREVFAGGA